MEQKNYFMGLRLDALATLLVEGAEVEFLTRFTLGECSEGLWRHRLPDGRVFDETVQYFDSTSGRVFLALRDEDGRWVRESLWSDQLIGFAQKLDRI